MLAGGLVVQLPLFRERRVLLGNYNSIIVSGQMYRMAGLELNCNTTGKMIALLSGLQVPLNINLLVGILMHFINLNLHLTHR